MAFPKTDDDCLNDLDDYNALVNYVNDLTAFYNLREKFKTGTTGTVADLPLMAAGDCWNLPTFWSNLQDRLSRIAKECVDWDLVTAGRDINYANFRYIQNINLWYPDEGKTDYFERLCSLANAELSAAGITGQDLDSTNWTSGNTGLYATRNDIPFTRKPSGGRGPLHVLDQTSGLQATRDCIDATIVNQIWAVCKVLESCSFFGYITNNTSLTSKTLGGQILNHQNASLSKSSGVDCATALNLLESFWPSTWTSTGTLNAISATVTHTAFGDPITSWNWTAGRFRGQYRFTDIPVGSDVDHKFFAIYVGDDFFDTAETQNAITDLATTTGNASATYTTGYYGNYATSPTEGANRSIDCSDGPGTYEYTVYGFLVFRKNFTAPS